MKMKSDVQIMLRHSGLTLLSIFILMTLGCGNKESKEVALQATQRSIRYQEHLYSVCAVDTQNVWAAGYWGTILHSADGGKSWQVQETGTNNGLNCIKLMDLNNGWAVGDLGAILNTNDGGKTWNLQKSNIKENLLRVGSIDLARCWAVGDRGTMLHTEDGGKEWKKFATELVTDEVLNDVKFMGNEGWVVGEFGMVLHTTDGGINWERKPIPSGEGEGEDEVSQPYLFAVDFIDPGNVLISSIGGLILRTEDSGKSWAKIETGLKKPLYDIRVVNSSGYVVGLDGTILESSDYGRSFAKGFKAPHVYNWLGSVSFSDKMNGWIVGANGVILNTRDGGESWGLVQP